MGDLGGGTGFGTVTCDLGRAMLAQGDDLRFLSLNEDGKLLDEPFLSRAILLDTVNGWLGPDLEFAEPGINAAAVIERVRRIFTDGADGWLPEAVLVIGDPASVIFSHALDIIPVGFPAYHYVPIEGVGLPPSWGRIWQRLRPIAMSRFGADEIEKLTGDRPPFVYHGVDTEAFYPVSRDRPIVITTVDAPYLRVLRSRDECKAFFRIRPEVTVLFRADRNMPRKRYATMLRAVAPVLAQHPAIMLMHCLTLDEGGNLDDFRSFYHPAIAGRMVTTGFHDAGRVIDRNVLNAMYNAADIYVSTGSEGFGLTIAESIAAGTPVVGMDFSSVPEIIGPAGVVVPAAYGVENIYGYSWAGIDEEAFTKAVEFLVTHKTRRLSLGRLGPAHVKASFSWVEAARRMSEIMTPALEAVA